VPTDLIATWARSRLIGVLRTHRDRDRPPGTRSTGDHGPRDWAGHHTGFTGDTRVRPAHWWGESFQIPSCGPTVRAAGSRIALVGVTCALTLAACGSPTPSPAPTLAATATSTVPPSTAAYADVTATRGDTLAQTAEASGLRQFVLSFVLSDGGACRPSWGGIRAVDDPALAAEVADLRAAGGDVAVASGGADGSYLENACPDAESLAAAYGTVLDATGARRLEVDIEQDVPTATVVDALARVRQERGTEVTLTLQVESAEHGLTDQAVEALAAAAAAGLDVRVNAMVMNFPDPGNWAAAMTSAADRIAAQIVQARPDLDEAAARRLLGLTFMIGRNDTGAVTTLDDAARLATYATEGGAGSIAFWSIGRDNGDCPDGTLQSTCSGVAQDRYAFARTLAQAA
jgi:chitinase